MAGPHPYVRAAGLGVVSGLRSMTSPALASFAARRRGGGVLALLAAGELIADKFPRTPSRLRAGPLVARIAAGGFAGSTAVARHGGSRRMGVLLGALGAAAGAVGGYYARRAIVERLGVPEFAVALAEDAVAVGGAFILSAPGA